jgi:excisionase family DNA binding protein
MNQEQSQYSRWTTFLTRLSREVDLLEIPALVGALEQCKVTLMVRLWSECDRPPQTASTNAPLLSLPEVAARLRLPKGRVYELARQGRLPAVRIGKYVRVQREQLEAWIAKQHT